MPEKCTADQDKASTTIPSTYFNGVNVNECKMELLAPFDDAITQLKSGGVVTARDTLGLVSTEITDEQVTNALIALEQGLAFVRQGRHPEAVSFVQQASETIKHSIRENCN